MKAFKSKDLYKSVLLSLYALSALGVLTLFAACKTDAEFDGDILEAINADTSSTISFKKDKDSPVAFEQTYTIGGNYTLQDLPGNDDEKVDQLNPGFDLVGWKLDDADNDLRNVFTFDENGCISSFHMGPRSITLYGGGYTASTDTPYKIIYKTQNITMDGYDYYDELAMTGTTSTPEEPSYTDAANNLITIPGFTVRSDLVEQEILADGSAVVEVLYDRNLYTLTLHANDGSGTGEPEDRQNFYYGVQTRLTPNAFSRSGCSFAGWATSRERAAAGTVDYSNGENYTIGIGDADLYAVWTLPHISVTISLPGADEVGITYALDTTDANKVNLSAVIPAGHTATEYTYNWFYTNDGPGSTPLSTLASFVLDTTGWSDGTYQITLIAIHTVDSIPSGGTVQITVGN